MEKIYNPSKPTTTAAAAATNTKPPFPTTKSQLYGATRPTYRPQPQRRHRRGCCCTLFIWLTLTLITIIFLAAIASSIIYILYRPHRPSFTVDSLKISYINITSSKLNSKLNLTIAARNPNKKVIYIYNPIDISIFSNDVKIGDGSISSFVHTTKNTTTLKAPITAVGEGLDSKSETDLKSDLKNKNGLTLKVKLESKVKVKMGAIKSPKVRIRVSCDGIKATVPTGKTPSTASTADAKCNVDFRVKIWKWTF